ncbi:type III-B CRISPR-associated protein Cas10/Cmr2 [Coleofasciculus sp. G2-EDA-02]|uniref:type III-B CRISPR-associated protein Cas10/Cmr2 n=1 Tax=Coleofasciculus sp. G2-EDA-02 TaxID=3069529 RepID=UPI0032F19783
MTHSLHPLTIGIAWCLAWGEGRKHDNLSILQQMREALYQGKEVPEEVRSQVEAVQQLQGISKDYFPDKITDLKDNYPNLWEQTTRIGLVYGGATKIKGYVFESAKLPEIRGASALLDRINLIDLPAFFKCEQLPEDFPECYRARKYCQKVRRELQHQDQKLQQLWEALVPELVIYSTGGNILAFCPTAFVPDLVNLIEKRYTEETLTANSCAVGESFRLLELRFGLLDNPIEQTKWLDWYLQDKKRQTNPITSAYFGQLKNGQIWKYLFENRKNFNEITGKLAALFQKRRNGNNLPDVQRPSRRYPPMFETHPYLLRDDNTGALAAVQANTIPSQPWLSEPLARKRIVGLLAKRAVKPDKLPKWYTEHFTWKPESIEDWVTKFNDEFLEINHHYREKYYRNKSSITVEAAQTLTEIGDASDGFVGYIYADGNNMGGYIQKSIQSPEQYRKFSADIFEATKKSVYIALAKHLEPHQLQNLDPDDESTHKNGEWIHPFEILLLGGDDVLIVVPANKALKIAQTIGDEFESILLEMSYKSLPSQQEAHRYKGKVPPQSHCELSTSIGVLITAYNTPIYYAKRFYEQLLKSAKKKAKDLKKYYNYHGGTVDFLTLKSVTMISSDIAKFRQEGLTMQEQEKSKPTLKLYGAPYTLHELGGLIETGEKLKQSEFPRSQLYQIRRLLEQGKQTAMLNYRYFRVRLKPENQKLLADYFEKAWCNAKTNNGNLAPWMSLPEKDGTTTYETIWQELVELYPFIVETTEQPNQTEARLP